MPFTRSTRSTRSTSAQTSTTPSTSGTFSVSGQGLGSSSQHSQLSSLPVLRQPYYTICLTNDNSMFYTADAPGSTSYEDVLEEYNRLIATGVDNVFQISIVSSHVKTTYGGVVLEDAPASTSGFVSSSHAASTEISLDGYTFSRYGKGYLMKPVRGSAYLGNDYFLGGWWNESAGGWFFRRDCVRTLYELGAQFDGPTRSDPTRKFQQDTTSSSSEVDLTGRYYREYGKGLLLFPLSTEDPFYGQKYLLDGWWMDTQDGPGWFFRPRFEDTLVVHGAVRTTLFSDFEAFLATPHPTHVKFADEAAEDDEDLTDPEYTPDHDDDDEFIEEEYIEDPVDPADGPDTDEEQDSDLSDMIFIRYGKGYVLKPHRIDTRYGAGYFLGGFWNQKAHGWFFKREMKRFLKAQGATYLKMRV